MVIKSQTAFQPGSFNLRAAAARKAPSHSQYLHTKSESAVHLVGGSRTGPAPGSSRCILHPWPLVPSVDSVSVPWEVMFFCLCCGLANNEQVASLCDRVNRRVYDLRSEEAISCSGDDHRPLDKL